MSQSSIEVLEKMTFFYCFFLSGGGGGGSLDWFINLAFAHLNVTICSDAQADINNEAEKKTMC